MRIINAAGRTAREESFLADGNSIHGSISTRRLLSLTRRNGSNPRALGPRIEHGKKTPKGKGRKR